MLHYRQARLESLCLCGLGLDNVWTGSIDKRQFAFGDIEWLLAHFETKQVRSVRRVDDIDAYPTKSIGKCVDA